MTDKQLKSHTLCAILNVHWFNMYILYDIYYNNDNDSTIPRLCIIVLDVGLYQDYV